MRVHAALEEPIRAVAKDVFGQLKGAKEFDFKDVSSQFTCKVLIAALGLPMGDEAIVDEQIVRDNAVLLTTTTLIMAGVESLGGFMMMFAYNLATYDEARQAVEANPALLPDAIEESLRFNTSAQRFRRRLMKEVTLHGQTMKEGDFVCLAYGSGNRDERQYLNPDVYDITRKPRGHLGFGGGVHACLGTAIARLAVRIAFEEFHQVVPEYRRVADQLPWMPSSTFRSPLVLQLTRT